MKLKFDDLKPGMVIYQGKINNACNSRKSCIG